MTGATGAAVSADIAAQSEALARVGQAGPNLDPSQQQGVEMYPGGYLPASSLAALGANANAGFTREVMAERMAAVEEPWKKYEEVISGLDEDELSQLTKLESSRPDLVAKVLDNLMGNQEGITKSILDIEQERRQIAAGQAKIRQAQADLNYKYAGRPPKATTAAEKLALDRWYKTPAGRRISTRPTWRSGGAAEVSQGHLTPSRNRTRQTDAGRRRQQAEDARRDHGLGRPLLQVGAEGGRRAGARCRQAQERNKIRDALFESVQVLVAAEQGGAERLKEAITKWVYKLPIKQAAGRLR